MHERVIIDVVATKNITLSFILIPSFLVKILPSNNADYRKFKAGLMLTYSPLGRELPVAELLA